MPHRAHARWLPSSSSCLWLIGLVLAACRSDPPNASPQRNLPAAAPATVESAPLAAGDPVAVNIARFRAARRAQYEQARATQTSMEEPVRAPDVARLHTVFFAQLAESADRGDLRACGWCLEQLADSTDEIEATIRSGRAHAWWHAVTSGHPDEETLANLFHKLGTFAYLFDDALDGCARLEQLAQDPETKANAAELQVLLATRPEDAAQKNGALRRLAQEYAATRAGSRMAHRLVRDVTLRVGERFPGFDERRFVDLAHAGASVDPMSLASSSDATFRLADLGADAIALVFWDYKCGPCMTELPFERRLHERLLPRNARIVGVYTDSDFDHYRTAVEHYPVPWRNVWDGPGKLRAGPLCTELGVNGVPFTVVLDRRGVIRAVGARGKGLEQALEDVLASKDAGERK